MGKYSKAKGVECFAPKLFPSTMTSPAFYKRCEWRSVLDWLVLHRVILYFFVIFLDNMAVREAAQLSVQSCRPQDSYPLDLLGDTASGSGGDEDRVAPEYPTL